MRRLVGALVGWAIGYVAGAGAGAALVSLLSANTHDKSVELATTSLLVAGPIGAVLGGVIGFLRAGRGKR